MQFTRLAALGAAAFALTFGAGGVMPTRAQQSDAPGPNGYRGPLPRDEFEAAWVRLFDGETTYGWQEHRGSVVTAGSATPTGSADATKTDGSAPKGWSIDQAALQTKNSATTLATKAEFGDFEMAGECWLEEGGGATLSLRAPAEGNITAKNAVQIKFLPAGRTAAKSDTYLVPQGKWQPFAVTLEGGKFTHLTDSKGKRAQGNIAPRRGLIALTGSGKGTAKFRNLKLRPLGFKSLFNGKDLTGWKEVPGHQSVFSVTKDGELNIKNGNGEIQSESVYGDFALSIDVYSNGDHLNSGVFFREIPGQFWAGYEDQIRNQWQGEDRTKPVDYGTGAIYNRLPVRKVISSDREWFTMTLFVSGNHISSYVDGYLVADFTDTRPATADKNARNGIRTEAGCIGLQGHDPTTDLSFRNIRVAEMPPVKPVMASTTGGSDSLR